MTSLISIVLFGEGFITGIMLTVMLGPVTMIILRYGIQVNRSAGVWAAAGTWFSDILFIAMTYWMTTALDQWTKQPENRLSIFLAGGFGLLIMGLLMLSVKKRVLASDQVAVQSGYNRALAGGFLVNTLSPFTLFFWLGVAIFLHLQADHPLWYYTGVMVSLAIGDFTKAWLAPKLTIWLKEQYVYWIQVVAGILIAGTGLYVIVMGFVE